MRDSMEEHTYITGPATSAKTRGSIQKECDLAKMTMADLKDWLKFIWICAKEHGEIQWASASTEQIMFMHKC